MINTKIYFQISIFRPNFWWTFQESILWQLCINDFIDFYKNLVYYTFYHVYSSFSQILQKSLKMERNHISKVNIGCDTWSIERQNSWTKYACIEKVIPDKKKMQNKIHKHRCKTNRSFASLRTWYLYGPLDYPGLAAPPQALLVRSSRHRVIVGEYCDRDLPLIIVLMLTVGRLSETWRKRPVSVCRRYCCSKTLRHKWWPWSWELRRTTDVYIATPTATAKTRGSTDGESVRVTRPSIDRSRTREWRSPEGLVETFFPRRAHQVNGRRSDTGNLSCANPKNRGRSSCCCLGSAHMVRHRHVVNETVEKPVRNNRHGRGWTFTHS